MYRREGAGASAIGVSPQGTGDPDQPGRVAGSGSEIAEADMVIGSESDYRS